MEIIIKVFGSYMLCNLCVNHVMKIVLIVFEPSLLCNLCVNYVMKIVLLVIKSSLLCNLCVNSVMKMVLIVYESTLLWSRSHFLNYNSYCTYCLLVKFVIEIGFIAFRHLCLMNWHITFQLRVFK